MANQWVTIFTFLTRRRALGTQKIGLCQAQLNLNLLSSENILNEEIMRIFIVLFLSIFGICGANATTFDISANGLSGTITINTTAGTITSVDLTSPGLSAVTTLQSQTDGKYGALFTAVGPNSETFYGDLILLSDGLVGYTGGIISYLETEAGVPAALGLGSLTPAVSTTPLPASWTMMLAMLVIGLGFKILTRSRRDRNTQAGVAAAA
jgi:hypothetical protein